MQRVSLARSAARAAGSLWAPALRTSTPLTFQIQRASFSKAADRFDYSNAHKSNAETLIDQVPVIYVDGPVAVCDGGGGALGHPVEYIQLDKAFSPGEPVECKYCGLRFAMKH